MGSIWSSFKPVLPPAHFTPGMAVEELSVTWTIENFNVIRLDRRLINSERIDFSLGGREWSGRLVEQPNNGKRWIAIHIESRNGEPFRRGFMVKFGIRSKRGWLIKCVSDFGAGRVENNLRGITNVGYDEFIDADDYLLGFMKTIVIHISFKGVTPTHDQPQLETVSATSLEVIQAEFEPVFYDQLRKDLAEVLNVPDPCTDIKLVSSDKKEFNMKKGALAVRSEVFAAMLRSDMIEANSGVINLPDISSKALKVLLNFLKTGELLPEWKETGVIVELTNAAGKYQLQDLLEFLNEAIGRACQLENVGALATLARRLSLRRAEDELMQFARREGVGSVDNFIRMWKSELAVIDDESVQE